jgi:predicted DCC family thiol-disulfide oxidoreductase YuxK
MQTGAQRYLPDTPVCARLHAPGTDNPYVQDMSDPVIIYDGECRFCQWSVRRIRKLDRRRQFEFAPRQTEGLDQRFPVLTESDFNTGLRLIDAEAVYVGADAIYQIYRHLPPHNLVAWLYRVPPFTQLARLGYAIIARNRHRFGLVECDTGACAVPVAATGESSSATTMSS